MKHRYFATITQRKHRTQYAFGRAAIEYCRAHPLPDLILLDGCMPEMDGIAFLKWLRAEPQGATPYVLFCSSSLDIIDVQEALRLGADKHYAKPISQTTLRNALTEASKRTEAFPRTHTQSSKYHP